MYCSNCGKELQNGAKFCSECGTKIGSQCSSNSSKIRSNNICPSCGSIMKREWIRDDENEIIGSKLYCTHCDREEMEEDSDEIRIKMINKTNIENIVATIGCVIMFIVIGIITISMLIFD